MLKYILATCLLACLAVARHEQYEGLALFDITPASPEQAKLIYELQDQLSVTVPLPVAPGRSGNVLVSKEVREKFQSALEEAGVEYKVDSENIKENLDLEDSLLAAARSKYNATRDGRLSFEVIHTYEEVDQYLVELGNRYPDIVTVVSAGRSVEGRDIKYLRISTTNFQDRSKPVIMLQSLLHAREWVTLPATLYAIQKLVIDVTEQDLLQQIDWIILPVVNPDGYVHSHNVERYWRKNRRRGFITGDICMGVDLNRNFDIFWGQASSNMVCFDDFHGPNGFSEPETAIIRDIVLEHASRMELYLDIHSFGSYILYGYGTGQLPANALSVHVLGVEMAQAIDRVKWANHPIYRVGNIALMLYQATGGASDYAMGVGVPFSYTYELPAFNNMSNSLLGFLVDPAFIEQAGFETWEGIKAGARFVLNLRKK